MSRFISKIRMNEKNLLIQYMSHNTTNEGDIRNSKITVQSEIKPHPQFFNVFQKLKKFVIGYMELSPFKNQVEDSISERYVVNSLSVKHDTDTTKIVVSITKTLANGKSFSINSPLIDLSDDEFSEMEDFSVCFDDVISEAEEYIEGKNGEEQMEIRFASEAA